MIALVLLAIFTGAMHGFTQGMVMSKKHDITSVYTTEAGKMGVRSHIAFGIYHFVLTFYLASVVSLTLAIHNVWKGDVFEFLPFFFGLMILAWRSGEVMYAFSRWARWESYEHVVILDLISFRLDGWKHSVWVFSWTVIAVGLLIIGGK